MFDQKENTLYRLTMPIEDEGFSLYKIAFMWYGPLGGVIAWIAATIISYVTGGQDLNELDVNLLAPCIKYLLPKKYRHVELKRIEQKLSRDQEKEKEAQEMLKN